MPLAVIIGLSSDIGRELARRFLAEGWVVKGTLREAAGAAALPADVEATPCDLLSADSVRAAVATLRASVQGWNAFVVAAGTEEPIGEFMSCDPEAWKAGIVVNALAPLEILRGVFDARDRANRPSVAFFSGSGTNSASPSYSAYSASKILLIKMCELLDAECPDTSFFIIGPGIVRTKIHQQTLRAGDRGGSNYRKVVDFLASQDPGTSHDDVYSCLRWCMDARRSAIGGRNISLVHDAWRAGGETLLRRLERDGDLYKLRRFGNGLSISEKK